MEQSASESRVVLASGSPRRQEIMEALALTLEQVTPEGEEGPPHDDETPHQFTLRLSLEKARRVVGQAGQVVVLGADTVVVLDGKVLGKPASNAEAARMLQMLRGRVHTVVTGVTALDGRSGRWLSATKSTDVKMRRYSDDELMSYVASGDPLDKAGGYAVQHEGFHPAEDIQGCYLNVVGLPLCEVVDLLDGLAVQARLRPDWQIPERCGPCPLAERQEVFEAC